MSFIRIFARFVLVIAVVSACVLLATAVDMANVGWAEPASRPDARPNVRWSGMTQATADDIRPPRKLAVQSQGPLAGQKTPSQAQADGALIRSASTVSMIVFETAVVTRQPGGDPGAPGGDRGEHHGDHNKGGGSYGGYGDRGSHGDHRDRNGGRSGPPGNRGEGFNNHVVPPKKPMPPPVVDTRRGTLVPGGDDSCDNISGSSSGGTTPLLQRMKNNSTGCPNTTGSNRVNTNCHGTSGHSKPGGGDSSSCPNPSVERQPCDRSARNHDCGPRHDDPRPLCDPWNHGCSLPEPPPPSWQPPVPPRILVVPPPPHAAPPPAPAAPPPPPAAPPPPPAAPPPPPAAPPPPPAAPPPPPVAPPLAPASFVKPLPWLWPVFSALILIPIGLLILLIATLISRAIRDRRGQKWVHAHVKAVAGTAPSTGVEVMESRSDYAPPSCVVRLEPHADSGVLVLEEVHR
jgi:hypothetical protein